MSHKSIMTPTSILVCDLCGEAIDTYSGDDRSNLKWGHTPQATTSKPTSFLLHWYGRDRKRGWDKTDDLSDVKVEWDFHGACLVRTLLPIISPPAPVSPKEVTP